MESYCQCLRCGKRIPIRPEMVGQTILCPSCLERVYVTPADQAPKPAKSGSLGSAEPSLSPSAEAALARLKQPGDTSGSLPIGLIAGVGGAVALVVIVALVMLGSKPSTSGSPQAANSGAPTSPQPGADTGNQLIPAAPAKAPVGPLSPEFLPKKAPGAPPTPFASNDPTRPPGALPVVPGAQPVTPGGVLISSTSGAGSTSSTLPVMQPQSLGANWSELWRSPATSSSEPQALASIGEAPATWKVAAKSYLPDFRTLPNIIVEAESDQRAWTVKYVPDPANPQASAERESVATLRRDGPNLVFAWASPLASAEGRRKALNCLLDVSVGTVRRVGQLREPVRAEPIVLDLASEGQQVEMEIDDPPRPDALRFEIVGLSGFSSDAQVRGGAKTAMAPSQPGSSPGAMPPHGAPLPGAPSAFGPMPMAMPLGMQPLPPQQVVIECEEIPGFEIRVRFVRADASGKLTLAIDPVLNEGPKAEFDLSSPRILDRLEAEVQKPLATAQKDLGLDETRLKQWQDKTGKLKQNEPSAKDINRQVNWQRNLRDHEARVKEFDGNVNELKQKIKTYQTRIEVVTKLRSFLKDAHQHAQIHYVVYSECGQPDLLLIDARGQ